MFYRGYIAIARTARLRFSLQDKGKHISQRWLFAHSKCSDNYAHAQKSLNSWSHLKCKLYYRTLLKEYIRREDKRARGSTNKQGLIHYWTRSVCRRQARFANRAWVCHQGKLNANPSLECEESSPEPQGRNQSFLPIETNEQQLCLTTITEEQKEKPLSEIKISSLNNEAFMITIKENDKLAKLLLKYESIISRGPTNVSNCK